MGSILAALASQRQQVALRKATMRRRFAWVTDIPKVPRKKKGA
jgi:hypothetical protein